MSLDTIVDVKFSKLWSSVATPLNFIEPLYPSGSDNWTHERYSSGGYVVGMMDSGYHRYICRVDSGNVLWRVDEQYGKPTAFHGIDRDTFLNIGL